MRQSCIATLALGLWACTGGGGAAGQSAGNADGEAATDTAGTLGDGAVAPMDTGALEVSVGDAAQPDGQAQGDGAPGDDAQAGGKGGAIAIYLTGDAAPKTFADGLTGQTPKGFEIALSRYHLLKSADDPAPVLCFDHGAKQVVADLSADTLVGTCPTTGLPTGVYTHGRVKVEWARYTVSGQLHGAGATVPGSFTFLRAWSDTQVEGKTYKAGQGTLTFHNAQGVQLASVPYTYPPPAPMTGVKTETEAGEFTMTFAWTHPLAIAQDDPGQHWARFHWHIFEGFRWKDTQAAGHTAGKWDVWSAGASTEEVKVAGVTGYHVSSSAD